MSDNDIPRIREAFRLSERRFAEQVLNVWMFGGTNPRLIAVEFCAADFVLEVLPS